MKIANWNIEWMNRWFSNDSNDVAWKSGTDAARVGISDLPSLVTRVGQVITEIDADVVNVQEGPSRLAEMQLFVTEALADRYEIFGPSGHGQQKLYTLVKKEGAVADVGFPPPPESLDIVLAWEVDIDGDMFLDFYEFTREPLLIDVTAANGVTVRVINLHTKSKYVHNGAHLWLTDRQNFVVKALKARRRISAEVMRVRQYIDAILMRDPGALIAVTGDLNDGPGTDYFERHYLTHNLVAMIGGSPFHPNTMLRHAFIDTVAKEDNFTAVFDDFVDGINDRHILLDHILVSPGLYWYQSATPSVVGKIEHDAFNRQIDLAASGRQRLPSDHRPQSVVLAI